VEQVFCKNCGTRLTEQQNLPNIPNQNVGITTLPYAMFRANPQHTGEYDNGRIMPTNSELWRFATGHPVHSSPAVLNGIVYVGSGDKNLYAIDALTGKEKWRFATESNVESSPSVSKGVIYVGSHDFNLYAIDAATGKEKWRFETDNEVSTSPAVSNGVVYIGSWDNYLYAIDAVTGKEKWRFKTGSGVSSSPSVSNGVVYVGSRDKNLYAIDALTGKEKWRFPTGSFVKSSPAVSNGVVYVGSWDKNLYAIDALTGKEKWRFATGSNVESSPAVSNGVVYVGSWDKNLYAIDVQTGKEKWRFATDNEVRSSPAVSKGVIFIGSHDFNLYAIDAATGKEKWRFATVNEVYSSPSVSGGVVYVGSWDNNLYAIGTNETILQLERITKLKEKAHNLLAETEQLVQVPDSIKTDFQVHDEQIIERAFKELESLRLKTKPALAFTFDHTDLIANRWHKIGVPISNTGISDAFDITLTFSKEFEVKRVQPITIAAGKTGTIELGILPERYGKIPFEITIEYRDAIRTPFKETQEFWIDVAEKSATTSPQFETPSSPVSQFTPRPLTPKQLPPDLLDRYTESEFIGKGGFARVFKAKRKDGKFVAVKIPISIDAVTGKSFIAEMQNWTKLSHPNIVRLFDYNIMPMPYFEEELCDSALAEQRKPIESEEAAWILFNICEGLKFAHDRKIIHRDLKPQNILLKNGVPKISDWGLSRIISESTTTSATSFTPYYAAPEQINNRAKDERTDIWQLGVILYELVTGMLPFTGDSMVEIGMNIATKDPKRPGEIIPDAKVIDTVVMKCLEKDPKKRYPSVLELQKDLALYLRENYAELLKTSVTVKDYNRSAYYCGDLVMINLLTGDIPTAYKYLLDLVHYSKGDVKVEARELSEQIKMRMEMGVTEIPDELIQKAEIIVHQVSVGFRK